MRYYYEYLEWIEWPREDVIEYAEEIAASHGLSGRDARWLTNEMLAEARHEHLPPPKSRLGPFTMSPDMIELARQLGKTDADILKQKVSLNKPRMDRELALKAVRNVERQVVGEGLSQKILTSISWGNRFFRKDEKRRRKSKGAEPFRHMQFHYRRICDAAFWRCNAYPRSIDNWITTACVSEDYEPYSGRLWYVKNIWQRWNNATNQAKLGNQSAAMWHAFRLGELCMELELLLAHGEAYSKAQATRRAQSDAAKSRKRVSDESRREAYWKYRTDGHKKIEAGRLAGDELGLSEGSIRNAFPDQRYPDDISV